MKTIKYLLTIEMPEGDYWSATDIEELLQTDSDIEDKGRWKIKVSMEG